MEYINDLYDLCEVISDKIAEANEKIRRGGGELSGGDVDYIDKLTHTLKSIKAVIAMEEADSDGGWSSAPRGGTGRTRTRTRTPRRDGMGYYSRADGSEHIVKKLESLMREASDAEVRDAISTAIDAISVG